MNLGSDRQIVVLHLCSERTTSDYNAGDLPKAYTTTRGPPQPIIYNPICYQSPRLMVIELAAEIFLPITSQSQQQRHQRNESRGKLYRF